MPGVVLLVVAIWAWGNDTEFAVTLADLAPGREWRVAAVHISGNARFSEAELRAPLLTKERPWYLPWKMCPVFDPVTFTTDLERLHRFYEARGYYETTEAYQQSEQVCRDFFLQRGYAHVETQRNAEVDLAQDHACHRTDQYAPV